MEAIISDLVNRFEKGALSRRGLIQGLAMLAASGGAASVAGAQETGLKGVKNRPHQRASYRSAACGRLYEKVFNLTVMSEDKPNEISRLGSGKIIVSLHHKSPTGIVDHFAIGVENFNKERVTQQLKALGITPEENLDAGFHIKDPEGMNVQIVPA